MQQQPTLTQLEEQAEAKRAAAARAAYIRWRMADLPAVYADLMPCTYDGKTLWEAERSIRHQVELDQRFLACPWRRVGPECGLLDYSAMTPQELTRFGLEISIPAGLPDAPKPGREDDPEVMAAVSPERQAEAREWAELMDRMNSIPVDDRDAAMREFHDKWGK